MCMLSYYPGGVIPKEERLYNGAANNPDGHGYAIVTKRREIMVYKSMNPDDAITRFMEARETNPEGPALFHSRISTGGLTDITGCHPFKVGQDNRTVVGHNGVLFRVNGVRSDTSIFAESMLPRFGSLDRPRKLRKLEAHIGKGNKLVILTVNPARRRNAYIINEAQGVWADGEWHSNHDFEYSYSKFYGAPYSFPADTGKSVRPCDLCGSINSVDLFTLVCEVCRSCQDCTQFIENCQCYYSPSDKKKLATLSDYDR